MKFRFLFLAALVAIFLSIIGCGGSGDSDASDPNGSFRMELNPSTDYEQLRHMAMQIDAEGGEITDALFRILGNQFEIAATTEVEGTASDGEIDLTVDFGKVGFTVEVSAEYTGLRWVGTYVVRGVADGEILEEGELEIVKTGTTTADIDGHWEGTATNSGGSPALILDISQKGNSFAVTGTYDGATIEGSLGIVIGDSVAMSLTVEDGSTVPVAFLVRVKNNGDRMEGVGAFNVNLPLTMEIERIEKP